MSCKLRVILVIRIFNFLLNLYYIFHLLFLLNILLKEKHWMWFKF